MSVSASARAPGTHRPAAPRVKFFKRPKEEPFGKHAIVQDPDGHLISIAEINEKSLGFDLLGFIGAE